MENKLILPPESKPILPHASAGDWDFSSADWKIQTDIWVSPPSALQLGTAPWGDHLYVVCKNAAVLSVPQGRIVTWLRTRYTAHEWYLIFRNTAAPGAPNINNCYLVSIRPSDSVWSLFERLNNAVTRSWTSAKTNQNANIWYRFRLSWWISWELMIVTLDLEVDGAWVQQGLEINVTNPLHGAATYQRPGTGAATAVDPYQKYIDDTEIWEYTP